MRQVFWEMLEVKLFIVQRTSGKNTALRVGFHFHVNSHSSYISSDINSLDISE